MEYDRGDRFPSDFEPNEILFGSKSKGKVSSRLYSIQFESKWKSIFRSIHSLRVICCFIKRKVIPKNCSFVEYFYFVKRKELFCSLNQIKYEKKNVSVASNLIGKLLAHWN